MCTVVLSLRSLGKLFAMLWISCRRGVEERLSRKLYSFVNWDVVVPQTGAGSLSLSL
jgi:hypothetical protein